MSVFCRIEEIVSDTIQDFQGQFVEENMFFCLKNELVEDEMKNTEEKFEVRLFCMAGLSTTHRVVVFLI